MSFEEPEEFTELKDTKIPPKHEEIPPDAIELLSYGFNEIFILNYIKRNTIEGTFNKKFLHQEKIVNEFLNYYLGCITNEVELEHLKGQGLRGLFRDKQIEVLKDYEITELIKDNNPGFLLMQELEDLKSEVKLLKDGKNFEADLKYTELKELAQGMYQIMNDKMEFKENPDKAQLDVIRQVRDLE